MLKDEEGIGCFSGSSNKSLSNSSVGIELLLAFLIVQLLRAFSHGVTLAWIVLSAGCLSSGGLRRMGGEAGAEPEFQKKNQKIRGAYPPPPNHCTWLRP